MSAASPDRGRSLESVARLNGERSRIHCDARTMPSSGKRRGGQVTQPFARPVGQCLCRGLFESPPSNSQYSWSSSYAGAVVILCSLFGSGKSADAVRPLCSTISMLFKPFHSVLIIEIVIAQGYDDHVVGQ